MDKSCPDFLKALDVAGSIHSFSSAYLLPGREGSNPNRTAPYQPLVKLPAGDGSTGRYSNDRDIALPPCCP